MDKEKAEQIDKLNETRNNMIVESGHYMKIEIVVGDDNMVIPKVEGRGATEEMKAMAIVALESTAKRLRKLDPIASMLTECMSTEETAYFREKRVDE